MARAAREVVGVMDETTTKAATRRTSAKTSLIPAKETLGGQYGASFTGRGTPGPHLRAPLDPAGRPSRTTRSPGSSAPPASPTSRARPSSSRRTSRSPTSGASSPPTSSSASTSAATSARPERETSVKQLIDRVVNTIAAWARDPALLRDRRGPRGLQGRADPSPRPPEDGVQLAGLVQRRRRSAPQCSACFINSVEDYMSSIMDLAKTEAMLFKYGSGAGSNLSPDPRLAEQMTGGGIASGPVSFMRGFDAFAGVIKSGGKTRRAAKMVILNADHPDVLDFIDSKANEEKKAWALIEQGYDPASPARRTARSSSRTRTTRSASPTSSCTPSSDDADWTTHAVVDGSTSLETFKARDILRKMAEAAHCAATRASSTTRRSTTGTPPQHGPDLRDQPVLRVHVPQRHGVQPRLAEPHEVRPATTASSTSRPTGSRPGDDHRAGDPRRQRGLPHAPDRGEQPPVPAARPGLREPRRAADVTAASPTTPTRAATTRPRSPRSCTARRYRQSRHHRARPRRPVRRVRRRTRRRSCGSSPSTATRPTRSRPTGVPDGRARPGRAAVWDEALELGRQHGYRNAQITVLAPTGTIAFMMDCDTTGIEPDIALVKYKKLVGEGFLKIVNQTVPAALRKLGYSARTRSRRSSPTSTSTRRSKARRASSRSTCRSSTARSSRSTASGPSTTWATSG